jgi:hypothetical protein
MKNFSYDSQSPGRNLYPGPPLYDGVMLTTLLTNQFIK